MFGVDNLQNKMNTVVDNLHLITDNIANVNTPGYKRKYVDITNDFKDKLSLEMKKTSSYHLNSINNNANEVQTDNTSMREDGNSVDIDTEVSELDKNNLFYQTIVKFLNSDISIKKNIISGR